MKVIIPLTLATALVAAPLALAGQDRDQERKKIEVGSEEPEPFQVGDTIPETLALVDIDGKTRTMKDLRGKTVVLGFWSITCPYMKNGEPKMTELFEAYKDQDVVLLGINSNVPELGPSPAELKEINAERAKSNEPPLQPYGDIRKHLKENEVPFTIIADHGNVVADLFAAQTTPHCFVIDGKGVLRYAGGLDDDPKNAKGDDRQEYVRMALTAVMKGEKVEMAETKPYGCTIKRVKAEKKMGGKKRKKDGA